MPRKIIQISDKMALCNDGVVFKWTGGQLNLMRSATELSYELDTDGHWERMPDIPEVRMFWAGFFTGIYLMAALFFVVELYQSTLKEE